MPTSLGLLYPSFPRRQHATVVGIWAGVAAVAGSAGPPIGGLLAGFDWRWIFVINVPIGAATLIAGWRLLPEVRAQKGARLPDGLSAAVLLAAVTLLILATVQGPVWGWADPRTDGLLAAALIAIGLTVARTLRHPHALIEKALFTSRPFTFASIALFLFFISFAVFLLTMALFLQGQWHYSAVLTGHPTVDYAVTALRNSAAEFMQKPIAADDLVAKATQLVEAGRKARAEGREIVLAIGAHPDDVEIGAGGTLLVHRAAGDTVAILTLSRGACGGDQAMRARESQEAADVIGARLFLDDLEDTRIQEGDPTIGAIDAVIAEIQPTVVYTHSVHDVHQDHRNVHRAAMVAARRVGRLYCFQSPSATIDFRPTYFVAINEHLGRKLKAIETFGSQSSVRDYMEPDLIASTARYWSRYCAGNHAEPFEAIRDRAGAPPARSGDSLSLASTPGHP